MLEGEIAKIEAMIAELDAAIAAIEAKIAEVEAKIAEAKAALEAICAEIAKVVEKVNALNDALANLVEEAKAAMNGAVADLKGAVEDVKAALDALVSELESEIAERIAEIADKAAEAAALAAEKLAELEAVVAEKVAEAVAALEVLAEELRAEAEALAAELKAKAEELAAELKVKAEALAEELVAKAEEIKAEIEAKVTALKSAAEELRAAAEAAAEELKADVLEAVALVEAKVEELIVKLGEAYEMVTLAIEYIIWSATEAYYAPNEDSYYVALGDGATAGGADYYGKTYVELLAAALGVDYTDLSEEGMTLEGMLALIEENKGVISGADIITVNYSNTGMLGFVMGQALVEGDVELDWSFLGENANEYVDALLAEVDALFAEEGLSELPVDITAAVEALAYYYASRVAYYPTVVSALHEASPEALVVIVGTYNDYKGCTLNLEGTEIKIGEYMQYVIDGLNLETFILAALNENTIYVDISEVETQIGEDVSEEEMMLYLMGNAPTEAGHEYITAQILDAINKYVCEDGAHVYDNDCDAYCNVCGAKRVVGDHVYDSVCDEDCNICGNVRGAAAHTYYNACDEDCNVCGKIRVVGDHVYTADCDERCNVCGEKREAAEHAWGEWVVEKAPTSELMGKRVRECTKCGASMFELIPVLADEAEDEGLSTGAVVAIVTVPSVFGLGIGGLAIYWFAYKKKSFADLKSLIMALFKKA